MEHLPYVVSNVRGDIARFYDRADAEDYARRLTRREPGLSAWVRFEGVKRETLTHFVAGKVNP